MIFKDILAEDKNEFNKQAPHPLQAYEWGEFRKKTGVAVVRKGSNTKTEIIDGIQLTIHAIPHSPWKIGYFPKSKLPTKEIIEELIKIGKENKCIFIQLEPQVEISHFTFHISNLDIRPSAHPLFTKHNLILDISPSEEELLAWFHPKTRYNIKVAQKYNVQIVQDNSDEAFASYWHLMEETTKRQGFYAHTKHYHELMWNTLKQSKEEFSTNELKAHLFLAKYKPEDSKDEQILTAWILFSFHDTLYYPYGASSGLYRKTMASNLMMWEAIRFGKKIGMKSFDMWGALGENPDTSDPWYGFHRFKEGYGPRHVTYIGSYDLIINPVAYELYKIANIIRWPLLKLRKLVFK